MLSPCFRPLTFISLAGALVLAAGCQTAEPVPAKAATADETPSTAPAPSGLRALDYAGDQRALSDLDARIAAAGQDPAKLAPIARELLAVLRDPAATYAGRQAAAQRLSLFPAADLLAPADRAALSAMLLDSQQVNLARLVLDRVPGPDVDAIYAEALPRSEGEARLALVESIGNRRIVAATATLAGWVDAPEARLSTATTKALGQIGTPESLHALQSSAHADSPAVVEAELTTAERLGGSAAASVYHEVAARASTPANLRAAAVRGLLFVEPDHAVAEINRVLAGQDIVTKPVVIEAIASVPAPDLVPALASQLGSLDASTQAAVIAALARRGDAEAVPAISTAARSEVATVRAAAIQALGRLPGHPDSTLLLGRIATGNDADDAKLARASLARLTGNGVADTVIAQATSGETPLRIVFLAAIADRNMADQIPLLLRTRADADPLVRSAALGAIADIGPASIEPEVLDWAAAATDSGERSRALRALAAVALRNPDAAARARPVTARIETAEPAVAVRLMPVLPRIGGAIAANSAGKLAMSPNASVAIAAVNALSRWDDAAGLQPLVSAAEETPDASVRTAAVQGALRFIDRTRTLPSAELTDVVRRLVPVTPDAAPRTQLVYLLGRGSDASALSLAKKLQSDSALTAVATDAAQAIQANLKGRPTVSGSGPQRLLPNLVDGKPETGWGCPATAGQWLEFDFHAVRPVKTVTFLANEFSYPEHVEIFVTNDRTNPGTAVASADGQSFRTVVTLPAVAHGRYLIIRHTKARVDSWWWMSEVQVD